MPRSKEPNEHCEEECQCPESVMPISFDAVIEEYLRRTRRLLLVGEINNVTAAHICGYLQVYSLSTDPVYMYINSPGGCLSAGYAIIDQMLSCKCPIITIVRGQAHSMGAILTAFGDERFATPHSTMMLHSAIVYNPPCSVEHHGKMFEFAKDDYRAKMIDLAKKMKTTRTKLIALMAETIWMQPKQAMKIGLIDGIWTPKKEQSIDRKYR